MSSTNQSLSLSSLSSKFPSNKVIWDPSSQYKLDELVESQFVFQLLHDLLELLSRSNTSISVIIFSHTKPQALPYTISDHNSQSSVLIYLSCEVNDYTTLAYLSRNYLHVFKTYYIPTDLSGITPLHCGVPNSGSFYTHFTAKTSRAKEYDLFFAGAINSSRVSLHRALYKPRIPFLQLLDKKTYKYLVKYLPEFMFLQASWLDGINHQLQFNRSFMSGKDTFDYHSLLCNSKICICPPGYDSLETFRHIEALRASAVVISLDLPPVPFYRNSPIIQINSWVDMPSIILDLLVSPTKISEISCQSSSWWHNNFSPRSTASYIFFVTMDIEPHV